MPVKMFTDETPGTAAVRIEGMCREAGHHVTAVAAKRGTVGILTLTLKGSGKSLAWAERKFLTGTP